jgi:hypothetical protein
MQAAAQVAQVNALVKVHSMWDGFWIHDFDGHTLTVSASFDRLYYRNYDIIFEAVTFFNLPDEWRDPDVPGEAILRLANGSEFSGYFDEFDTSGKEIFAIDLCFRKGGADKDCSLYTFYIIATKVYALECQAGNSSPAASYTDPFEDEPWPCMANRVTAWPH